MIDLSWLKGESAGVPRYVWAGLGVLAAWLIWYPAPSWRGDAGWFEEDRRTRAPGSGAGGFYSDHMARAHGLPPVLHHLCPVTWDGRVRLYPVDMGLIVGMAVPDPADELGTPVDEFGIPDFDRDLNRVDTLKEALDAPAR